VYRATPHHKVLLVQAFQRLGDVVAMTGDGVNDAPALKRADIGIAMGLAGTDVAREAADLILVNDDFSSIMKAIREGKAIFHNVKNFVRFQLSTSIAALLLIVLSTLAGVPNPMNAMQILWINIIMDGPPAQSLGVEPAHIKVMSTPPSARDDPIVSLHLIAQCAVPAIVTVLNVMLAFYHGWADDGEMSARDITMTFTTFVICDMWSAWGCRSPTMSIFTLGLFTNKALNIAISCVVLGQLALIYVPGFQHIFRTEALPLIDLAKIVLMTSSVLIADELRKLIERSKILSRVCWTICPLK
jgi:Ca2+-transporting ATPase